MKLARNEKGEKVALKIIPYSSNVCDVEHAQAFYNEVDCMARIDHPNVCKIIDFNESTVAVTKYGHKADISYIAMEYQEEGDLFDWISKTGKFSEDEARYYFHQLITSLEELHRNGFYHRDIKPDNILLDKSYNLKLVDFGFVTRQEL